jgi:general secretion pathway protein G
MVVRPPQPARAATRSAFTLLEVLIVVAILVVLAGVSSVYVFRYLEDAKVGRAKADCATLAKAAQAYEIQFGQLPESLQQLVQTPDGRKPFVEPDALMDPWGKPYQYDPSGQHNNALRPDVYTVTPEGLQVGNWK